MSALAMDDDYVIKLSEQFSDEPYGRYAKHGPFNGERFRDEYIVPALAQHAHVTIDLRNTAGFGSSFLDEAFGGLVAYRSFAVKDLEARISFIDDRKIDSDRCWRYIKEAAKNL